MSHRVPLVTPEVALAEILKSHGLEILQDRHQFEGVLRDYCADGTPREIFALLCAQRLGIPHALLEPSELPLEARHKSLVNRLAETFWLAPEAAAWAVGTWQVALTRHLDPAHAPPLLRQHRIDLTPLVKNVGYFALEFFPVLLIASLAGGALMATICVTLWFVAGVVWLGATLLQNLLCALLGLPAPWAATQSHLAEVWLPGFAGAAGPPFVFGCWFFSCGTFALLAAAFWYALARLHQRTAHWAVAVGVFALVVTLLVQYSWPVAYAAYWLGMVLTVHVCWWHVGDRLETYRKSAWILQQARNLAERCLRLPGLR